MVVGQWLRPVDPLPQTALDGGSNPLKGRGMSDGSAEFVVLMNEEGQYSLWSAAIAVPAGWTPDGFSGSREECMAHVDRVWTDLRPKSLQKSMAKSA